ncbi:hypothetical protein NDU88_004281 [Pleurodeles waltl]|uniref:Uncharacterized protein n=1 Tax=Pleurodeles waltl TaxID=8319 RepID=A0AAV7NLT2_PLEWA|nr:hypothetical protein NDU88_004281 [Pleurodeles waltl]
MAYGRNLKPCPEDALQIPNAASADINPEAEKKVRTSEEAVVSWKEQVNGLAEKEENECGTALITRTEDVHDESR